MSARMRKPNFRFLLHIPCCFSPKLLSLTLSALMALPPIQIPPKNHHREAILVGRGTLHTIVLPTEEEEEVSSFESDSVCGL